VERALRALGIEESAAALSARALSVDEDERVDEEAAVTAFARYFMTEDRTA
jgi:hypothetical protein